MNFNDWYSDKDYKHIFIVPIIDPLNKGWFGWTYNSKSNMMIFEGGFVDIDDSVWSNSVQTNFPVIDEKTKQGMNQLDSKQSSHLQTLFQLHMM